MKFRFVFIFIIYLFIQTNALSLTQDSFNVESESEEENASPEVAAQIMQVQPPQLVQEGKSCVHTLECESASTVLTCNKGKCSCPDNHLKWTRGNFPLNTVWDGSLRKCLGVSGAACDIFFPKSVYCQQGLSCSQDGKTGFGSCVVGAASSIKLSLLLFISVSIANFYF